MTFWSDVIAKRPESPRAHNKLGVTPAAQGRLGEATEHYREALRIDPDSREARANLERARRARGAPVR